MCKPLVTVPLLIHYFTFYLHLWHLHKRFFHCFTIVGTAAERYPHHSTAFIFMRKVRGSVQRNAIARMHMKKIDRTMPLACSVSKSNLYTAPRRSILKYYADLRSLSRVHRRMYYFSGKSEVPQHERTVSCAREKVELY